MPDTSHRFKVLGVSLSREDDWDIIEWVEGLGRREISVTIRDIIRDHLRGEDEHRRDTRRCLEILERMEMGGVAVNRGKLVSPESGELLDAEVRKNLEGLGV